MTKYIYKNILKIICIHWGEELGPGRGRRAGTPLGLRPGHVVIGAEHRHVLAVRRHGWHPGPAERVAVHERNERIECRKERLVGIDGVGRRPGLVVPGSGVSYEARRVPPEAWRSSVVSAKATTRLGGSLVSFGLEYSPRLVVRRAPVPGVLLFVLSLFLPGSVGSSLLLIIRIIHVTRRRLYIVQPRRIWAFDSITVKYSLNFVIQTVNSTWYKVYLIYASKRPSSF